MSHIRNPRMGAVLWIATMGMVGLLSPATAVPLLEMCRECSHDMGIDVFETPNPDGVLEGRVRVPSKLALLGLTDVPLGEKIQFQVGQAGNLRVTLPRLNREHVLLSPQNGGWWPQLEALLGFRPDVSPHIGGPVLLQSGTFALAQEEAARRGRPHWEKADRAELCFVPRGYLEKKRTDMRPLSLGDYIEEVWTDMRPLSLDAAPSGAFLLLTLSEKITIGVGDVALRSVLDRNDPDELDSAMERHGLDWIQPRVPGFGDRFGMVGPSGAGKTTLLSIVRQVPPVTQLGLKGATEGDHVHFLPRHRIEMALCTPRKGGPLLLRMNDAGRIEVLKPASSKP